MELDKEMKIVIIKPSGEEIRIDGTKICHASPQKCWQEDPGLVKMLIRRAWRRGWQVKEVESEAG